MCVSGVAWGMHGRGRGRGISRRLGLSYWVLLFYCSDLFCLLSLILVVQWTGFYWSCAIYLLFVILLPL